MAAPRRTTCWRRQRPGRSGWKKSENWAEGKISLQFHGYPALARARQSLYGAARIGDFVVTRNYRLTRSGWAIIALSAAAIALGGCGRKGPLDLPPTASGPSPAVAADTET